MAFYEQPCISMRFMGTHPRRRDFLRNTGPSRNSILSFVAGNTSTTPCALTRRSAISPRSNSSSAGNLNKRKPSVTNHVDEYMLLYGQ